MSGNDLKINNSCPEDLHKWALKFSNDNKDLLTRWQKEGTQFKKGLAAVVLELAEGTS